MPGYLAVALAFLFVSLVLGVIALIRCPPEKIPDAVRGIGNGSGTRINVRQDKCGNRTRAGFVQQAHG